MLALSFPLKQVLANSAAYPNIALDTWKKKCQFILHSLIKNSVQALSLMLCMTW